MTTDTERDEDRPDEAMLPEERGEAAPGDESDSESGHGAVGALQRELEEAEERWKRARADYQNLKRRTLADHEAMLRRELQPLLESLLLVLDHLEMALAIQAESEDAVSLAAGVRLTRDQLVRALERAGVVAIPEGGRFDPAIHQSVATVADSGAAPGEIIQSVRRGYTWNGVVLRPAHVRVAVEGAGAQATGEREPTGIATPEPRGPDGPGSPGPTGGAPTA